MNNLNYYQEFHYFYKNNFTLNQLIDYIKNDKQIIFLKYGDGEVECMKVTDENNNMISYGQNCDNDKYFPELSYELKEAFIYFVNYHTYQNVHIGKWHSRNESDYLSKYYYEYQNKKNYVNKIIPYTNYHLVMNDKINLQNNSIYQFVKSIKYKENSIKIVVSNIQNQLLKDLFSSHYFVETPSSSLYLKIEDIEKSIKNIIEKYSNQKIILLTSCGLSAKVLIYRLLKIYDTQLSAIDLGSSFDLLCKKRITRTYQNEYSYETIYNYYHKLLS